MGSGNDNQTGPYVFMQRACKVLTTFARQSQQNPELTHYPRRCKSMLRPDATASGRMLLRKFTGKSLEKEMRFYKIL
jgi:hypothetical protein